MWFRRKPAPPPPAVVPEPEPVTIRITKAEIRKIMNYFGPGKGQKLVRRMWQRLGAAADTTNAGGIDLTEGEVAYIDQELRYDGSRGGIGRPVHQMVGIEELLADLHFRLGRAKATPSPPVETERVIVVPSEVAWKQLIPPPNPHAPYTLNTKLSPDETAWMQRELGRYVDALTAGDKEQAEQILHGFLSESRDGVSLARTLIEALLRHSNGEDLNNIGDHNA